MTVFLTILRVEIRYRICKLGIEYALREAFSFKSSCNRRCPFQKGGDL